MNDLQNNIKRALAARKWNAYDLERASGVPQPTIQRILTGKHGDPRSSTIKKLAKGFGLTEAQLRGFDVNHSTNATAASTPEKNADSQPNISDLSSLIDRASPRTQDMLEQIKQALENGQLTDDMAQDIAGYLKTKLATEPLSPEQKEKQYQTLKIKLKPAQDE